MIFWLLLLLGTCNGDEQKWNLVKFRILPWEQKWLLWLQDRRFLGIQYVFIGCIRNILYVEDKMASNEDTVGRKWAKEWKQFQIFLEKWRFADFMCCFVVNNGQNNHYFFVYNYKIPYVFKLEHEKRQKTPSVFQQNDKNQCFSPIIMLWNTNYPPKYRHSYINTAHTFSHHFYPTLPSKT